MQQLQDFLNECIKRGWKHPDLKKGENIKKIVCKKYRVEFYVLKDEFLTNSYHDLFSVESGLMEWVKRKKPRYEYVLPVPPSHYINMCQMTAEQKIQYFLDNALLPEHNLGKI